jgi:hypothetical protein
MEFRYCAIINRFSGQEFPLLVIQDPAKKPDGFYVSANLKTAGFPAWPV